MKGTILAHSPVHRFAPAALAVVLVCSLWGCQRNSTDHVAAANAAIAAKDPTAAVLHLKNALALDPNNGETRLL